jgi:hypothetical protein
MPETHRFTPGPYARETLPAFLAQEDPYQRLARCGAEALHTAELLTLLLGAGRRRLPGCWRKPPCPRWPACPWKS